MDGDTSIENAQIAVACAPRALLPSRLSWPRDHAPKLIREPLTQSRRTRDYGTSDIAAGRISAAPQRRCLLSSAIARAAPTPLSLQRS